MNTGLVVGQRIKDVQHRIVTCSKGRRFRIVSFIELENGYNLMPCRMTEGIEDIILGLPVSAAPKPSRS